MLLQFTIYSVFLMTVCRFENSKKQKFISSKFRKQEKFVTSKFRKNSHNFAAFSSKYRIERREIPREISPTCNRKFARTINEIRRNSLSLLLHSTVYILSCKAHLICSAWNTVCHIYQGKYGNVVKLERKDFRIAHTNRLRHGSHFQLFCLHRHISYH